MRHPFDGINETPAPKPEQHTRRSILGKLFGAAAALVGLGAARAVSACELRPSTTASNEEGGTTERVGEEGGQVTTLMTGEEGGDRPTTLRSGEEGGHLTTRPIREEGASTDRLGEEGGITRKCFEEGGPNRPPRIDQPITMAFPEEGRPGLTDRVGESGRR